MLIQVKSVNEIHGNFTICMDSGPCIIEQPYLDRVNFAPHKTAYKSNLGLAAFRKKVN